MTIAINEIQRIYRYNGIALPDVPGMTPQEVRDLYSAQYPELISAEIQTGEIINGVQEYTFRKAVGTKGRKDAEQGERLTALLSAVEAEAQGLSGASGKLSRALTQPSMRERGEAWNAFAQRSKGKSGDRGSGRVMPSSDMLVPLP